VFVRKTKSVKMSYYRVAPDYMDGSSTKSSLTSGGDYYDIRYRNYTRSYKTPYLLEMGDVPQRAEREIVDHGVRTARWDHITSQPTSETHEIVSDSIPTARWDTIQGASEVVTPCDAIEDPEFNDIEKAIALSKLFYLAEYGEEKTEEEIEASAPLLVEEDIVVIPQTENVSNPPTSSPSSPPTSSSSTVNSDCTVCMDSNRCIVFKPCGHVCCCEECADSILRTSSPKCPLCRQDLKSRSKTKVFI